MITTPDPVVRPWTHKHNAYIYFKSHLFWITSSLTSQNFLEAYHKNLLLSKVWPEHLRNALLPNMLQAALLECPCSIAFYASLELCHPRFDYTTHSPLSSGMIWMRLNWDSASISYVGLFTYLYHQLVFSMSSFNANCLWLVVSDTYITRARRFGNEKDGDKRQFKLTWRDYIKKTKKT